jgi:abortive infection bacteriophage resistance protein
MTKTTFSKKAATPEQLLAKLKTQGLTTSSVAEDAEALRYLRYVGGYRLKGYWYHLLNSATKQFPSGFRFNQIIERYEFDRELRSITTAAIEPLEIAIRCTIANHLSLSHSPHWFLDVQNVFKPVRDWGAGQLLSKIEQETGRARDKSFVAHYHENHDDPYLPPSWSVSECVTFGLWSRTYAILRNPSDKKSIAMKFGIDQAETFASWLHALTVLRNTVAHNGRLLRNKFSVSPSNSKNLNIKFVDNKSFYASATVINVLLSHTGLPQQWKPQLQALFAKYPNIAIAELGFSPNWNTQAGW